MSAAFPVFIPEIFHWSDEALCRFNDPEMWFPRKGSLTAINREAIKICKLCPVIKHCLEEGLTIDFGIYGGMTAPERARIREERGLDDQVEVTG